MGEDMSLCEYRGQRITSGTWFSSSILMRQDLASFCHNTYSKTVSVQMVINTLNLLNPCLSINFLSVVYNICALHLGPSNTILSLPQIAHLYLWAQIYNYCFMHWCLQPYRNNIQKKKGITAPKHTDTFIPGVVTLPCAHFSWGFELTAGIISFQHGELPLPCLVRQVHWYRFPSAFIWKCLAFYLIPEG